MIDSRGTAYELGHINGCYYILDKVLTWINSCPAENVRDFRSELYKYLMELRPYGSRTTTES